MKALLLLACSLSAAEPKVPVTALAFSPDNKTLVSGGYKEVRLWDATDRKLLASPAACRARCAP